MPPEAWPSNHRADDDTPVDLLMHASFDVYSLGIVAHQLLTGLTQPVACGQVMFGLRERGPACHSNTILTRFRVLHRDRVRAADEATRDECTARLFALYVVNVLKTALHRDPRLRLPLGHFTQFLRDQQLWSVGSPAAGSIAADISTRVNGLLYREQEGEDYEAGAWFNAAGFVPWWKNPKPLIDGLNSISRILSGLPG
eukprot:jgi/Undpi1/5622/HiC_scaffold_2.g00897.m1